jgi:hypothetical protein
METIGCQEIDAEVVKKEITQIRKYFYIKKGANAPFFMFFYQKSISSKPKT